MFLVVNHLLEGVVVKLRVNSKRSTLKPETNAPEYEEGMGGSKLSISKCVETGHVLCGLQILRIC